MARIGGLRGRVVGLDTAPLIYFIEAHPTYRAKVRPFFEALNRRELRVVTSTVTLLEVLVQPFRRGDDSLTRQYRDVLLNVPGLDSVEVSRPIAEEAARLRAAHNLRALDAIQLATAISAGADAFLTNDARLPRLTTLDILVLNEL